MTLGEFRKETKDFTDDFVIKIYFESGGLDDYDNDRYKTENYIGVNLNAKVIVLSNSERN
jgi:hypothetical protein